MNRALLKFEAGKWTAQDADSQKTSHFLNFAEVNGLAYLLEDVGNLDAGAIVKAFHFDMELG